MYNLQTYKYLSKCVHNFFIFLTGEWKNTLMSAFCVFYCSVIWLYICIALWYALQIWVTCFVELGINFIKISTLSNLVNFYKLTFLC